MLSTTRPVFNITLEYITRIDIFVFDVYQSSLGSDSIIIFPSIIWQDCGLRLCHSHYEKSLAIAFQLCTFSEKQIQVSQNPHTTERLSSMLVRLY